MRKIILLILTFILAFNLMACNVNKGEEMDQSNIKVSFIAEIISIEENILVNVLESQYTSGEHILIITDKTQYLDSDGNKIEKSNLNVGDKIKVDYSGQVMLSYPPQVVAYIITKQF